MAKISSEAFYSSIGRAYSTASATVYFGFGCSYIEWFSAEERAQLKQRTAGTWSNLRINIVTNARTTNTVFTFRINGADGNQSVTFGSGVTGFIEDTSNTDSISDGDLTCVEIATGTGTEAINIRSANVVTSVTSGSAKHVTSINQTSVSDGVTGYSEITGFNNDSTTEGNHQTPITVNTVLSNLQVFVNANTITSSTPFVIRINGGNGNQSLSVGASTTGFFEDTSATDSVSAGDLVNIRTSPPLGGFSIQYTFVGTKHTTDGDGYPAYSSGFLTSEKTADTYYPFGGYFTAEATEANTQYKVPFDVTASNLTVFILSSSADAHTFSLRINGVTGNQSIAIGASTTGVFEDTSSTDDLEADDLVNYAALGISSGAIRYRAAGTFLTEAAEPPSGRIMSSLAGHGGLASLGGIAGAGGGLAG